MTHDLILIFSGAKVLEESIIVREKMIEFLIIRTGTMISVFIISSSPCNKDNDHGRCPHKKDCVISSGPHNKDCNHGSISYYE